MIGKKMLGVLTALLAACSQSEECDLSDCGRNAFDLGLYQRFREGDLFLRTDTLAAGGEAALTVTVAQAQSYRSQAAEECMGCTSLLQGESLFSEHAIMAGGEILPSGVNLLDSARTGQLGTGEAGHRVLDPNLRFRKGSNRLRYEAKLVWEGKTLLDIRDTLDFHVDSAAGY